MSEQETNGNVLHPEQLVAENVSEAVWLRLRRLTSPTLCERTIAARAPTLSADVIAKKGQELAFAIRSALGYWQSEPGSLNAKVLTRYYALLQITIAEQVASPHSTADLAEIQAHTESGHGLWAMAAPTGTFPDNYMIACRDRGHFYQYCRFRGIDLKPFASKARPESWDKLSDDAKGRLISLADLLRRVPELQMLIDETLGLPPLSFHVGSADQNMIEQDERRQEHLKKTGELLFEVPVTTPECVTYVGLFPHGQKLTVKSLNALDLPLRNIRPVEDAITGQSYFVGDFTHPNKGIWWDHLETYKSGYSGTSLIVPFWGDIRDPIIIHLVTFYALSIVVRYLPLLWHEIEDGKLDHIRALIEHYVSIFDHVVPGLAIERITGRRFIAVTPGSLGGPI
ncbi:hypothetical protein FXB40_32265 [Bradyrhizobium rifense]|uniref:YaaC family protein n=1 Tax=Bradyrhizobium rifense TaxID=515499 RepID=A0A5D3KCC7_9BRAD|nr:hypothetical protein [Bradyrhizobium rifense]TYL90332.1 hypothetical protein FXB40_32265 [Bradyrhizobium rifense]